ncbi:hypothetical protein [Pedobacter sp. P26]|uniref:hypothetical protein n=1 Tax=Pedobacter sp. P26 TaxID=3423956 RepID=UPI003D6670EC
MAASVPFFAATKAEKAFGFRGNRVYLTQLLQETQTFHPPARPYFMGEVVRGRHFERSATCTDFTSVTQPRTRRLCEAKSVSIDLSISLHFIR